MVNEFFEFCWQIEQNASNLKHIDVKFYKSVWKKYLNEDKFRKWSQEKQSSQVIIFNDLHTGLQKIAKLPRENEQHRNCWWDVI